MNGKIEGSEDCLVLDVVTPEVRYINLLPVVVMIGSNDFNGGSPGKANLIFDSLLINTNW